MDGRKVAAAIAAGAGLCLVVIAVLWASGVAHALSPDQCAPTRAIVAELNGKYLETKRGGGTVLNRALVDLFVSDTKNTWTIVVTDTQGMTCVLAAGQDWEQLPPQPEGSPL